MLNIFQIIFKVSSIILFISYYPKSKPEIVTYEFTAAIFSYDDMPEPCFREGYDSLCLIPVSMGDSVYGRFSWDTNVT